MMKCYLALSLGSALFFVSCSQTATKTTEASNSSALAPVTATNAYGHTPKEPLQSRQYLALPGQTAQAVAPTDTDDAFDRQVAAYAIAATSHHNIPNSSENSYPFTSADTVADPSHSSVSSPTYPEPPARPLGMTQPAPGSATEPEVIHDPMTSQQSLPVSTATPSLPLSEPLSTSQSAASGGYAVQINNGTPGRLYVEVQDDSGNIFPIAFMHAGQVISTPPQEPKPIVGKLTVVIRDPDQPNAPELRRYKVTPPANYSGKTVGVTILPGGRYRASLDGEVYYTSPLTTPADQKSQNQN